MKIFDKTWVLGLALASGLLASPSVFAAWTFNSGNCVQTGTNSPLLSLNSTGTSATCKDDNALQPSVQVSAFGTNGTNYGNNGTYVGTASTFAAAQLGYYTNGNNNTEFAVTSSSPGDPNTQNPHHAMDNNLGTELLLFDFAKAGYQFTMTSFLTGWGNGDSDVTVLAYTGNGAPAALAGKTVNELVAGGGWTLINNYANTCNIAGCKDSTATGSGGVSNATATTTVTSVISSWWIISAFNGAYANPDGSGDAFADYVKIAAIDGTAKRVPEPASLALVAVALAGVFSMRGLRRKDSAFAAA